MEIERISFEASLVVALDNIVSEWLEEIGYEEGEDMRPPEQSAVNAAIAWLEQRYVE